jgi:hypothetical protein
MIKLLRKVSHNPLLENKFSRYLIYAIGEIILVVIGILIALQINNANEARKNNKREITFLENLKEDIKSDSLFYEGTWFKNSEKKIAGLEKAKRYYKYRVIPGDTTEFLNTVSLGGIYGIGRYTSNSRTYKELISTGNLSLISNDEIRSRITDYYLNQDFMYQYGVSLQSGYANYLNSIKVFNPKFPDSINTSDIPMMLKMMQKDEFYLLINKELTYAYSFLNRLEKTKKESHHLYVDIEAYLKQKQMK